jgi:hypothetical protein
VYLSKEEAMALSKEPPVGETESLNASEGGPPVKEGDYLMFQVQPSTEGFPQAVHARRMRRLRGMVVRAPTQDGLDGVITVQGDGSQAPEVAGNRLQQSGLGKLLGAEVKVRQVDCGQLMLEPNDEVAFCCSTAQGSQQLEAQLVELLKTSRAGGALLGCFSLEVPRALAASEDVTAAISVSSYVLDGHALVDRMILAGIPTDAGKPELMRVFGKLGATEAIVTFPDACGAADEACGFASVTFGGPQEIGKFLARAAHTISEQGTTQLARLRPSRQGRASLPALPTPKLTAVGADSLLVQWSQVSLAAGYAVELRAKPKRTSDGDEETASWHRIDSASVATGKLPAGLLESSCGMCRITSLGACMPYEARLVYYTPCGSYSEASAASESCMTLFSGACNNGMADLSAVSLVAPAALQKKGEEKMVEPSSCLLATPGSPLAVTTVAASTSPIVATGESTLLPPMAMPQQQQQVPSLASMVMPQQQDICCGCPPSGGGQPGVPEWKCFHGNLIPPAAQPEVVPVAEAVRGICVRWPMVIHAVAYTVELYEEGSTSVERFQRAVPEGMNEVLVELRVDNLKPQSGYSAAVRCRAPCGCESEISPWSYVPPAVWPAAPPPPAGVGGPAVPWMNGYPSQQQLYANDPMFRFPHAPPSAAPTAPPPQLATVPLMPAPGPAAAASPEQTLEASLEGAIVLD